MNKALSFVLTLFFLASCASYTFLTAKDLEQMGTKTFTNKELSEIMKVAVNSLNTLGYPVTVQKMKPEKGLIKTAPQIIMTSARGSQTKYSHSANITRDGIAWEIKLTKNGKNTTLVALPKAFRNGVEMTGDKIFVKRIMDPRYKSLFQEIENSLSF